MTEIHCSTLPRLLSCPQSRHAPAVRIEEESAEARLGRAVHEALAAEVRGEHVDLEAVAQRHDVEVDAVRPFYFAGRRIWQKFEPALCGISVEVERRLELTGGVRLVGTPDIVAETIEGFGESATVVWDWKTGSEGDPWPQLLGYGLLTFGQSETEVLKCIVVWLREQFYEIRDFSADELAEFEARIRKALDSEAFSPTPENCRFCGRRHECPARMALVQASIQDFLAEAKSQVPAPERLARLYPQAQLLRQALDQYHAVLKATLEEQGPLPLGDGRQLVLEEARRETLAPWAVLQELPVETLMPAISISKPKLCRILADGAPRGQKKRAIEEFMSRLRDQGGVSETTFHKIAVRKVQEEGKDDDGD